MGASPLENELIWWKSSYSGQNGGDCIECAVRVSREVLVRDSKNADGPHLGFTAQTWTDFVGAATANSFGPAV
ncbi:DUF397 domain-containing protein [Streptomyces sp. NPDC058525]|uniref:DUF397 domain-containing protein n=1 Tax=Streptomyces sp. NPDC058525 TaxID=3346538 RepID=UPI0036689F59